MASGGGLCAEKSCAHLHGIVVGVPYPTMTKEQQRAEDMTAGEKTVRSVQAQTKDKDKDKDRDEPGEVTGKIAVSKKDLAVANAGQTNTARSEGKESLLETGLEKLEQLRSRALRPLSHVKWPQLQLRLPIELPRALRTLRVDVVSYDDDVIVRVDVSGMSKDRIDLAVSSDTLTVRGTAAAQDERGNYHYRELPHGPLERRISLPFEVQGDKASASVKNGLLEVVLPKSERSRYQKIAVN